MEKRLCWKRETQNIENWDSINKSLMSHHREREVKGKIKNSHHHMFLIVEREVGIKKVQLKDRKNNYIMNKVTVIMKMNIYHRSQNNA